MVSTWGNCLEQSSCWHWEKQAGQVEVVSGTSVMECGVGLFAWGGVMCLFFFPSPLQGLQIGISSPFPSYRKQLLACFLYISELCEEVLSEDSSDLVMTTLTSYLAGKELSSFQKLHKLCIYWELRRHKTSASACHHFMKLLAFPLDTAAWKWESWMQSPCLAEGRRLHRFPAPAQTSLRWG